MTKLDPATIAKIDQRAGECTAQLDGLIGNFRNRNEQFGFAQTLGDLAQYFQGEVQKFGMPAVTQIIDLLTTAISQLAEHDSAVPPGELEL